MVSFHQRVSEECNRSSRAIMKMADRLRELEDVTMAGVADSVAESLSKLGFDAMSETQPVTVPVTMRDRRAMSSTIKGTGIPHPKK